MVESDDSVYATVSHYTMVPRPQFGSNLHLALRAGEVPGAIVECGCWRGGQIAGIAKILGNDREYWLFDSFEGMPPAQENDGHSDDDGGISAIEWQKLPHGNNTAGEEFAIRAMAKVGITNYHLVKGWFEDTLPKAHFPEGIALLRLDADWHDSTMLALEHLFPQVNEGGFIIVDDFFTWSGCAKAVYEYLVRHDRAERITTEGAWWLGAGVCFLIKRAP